MSRPHSTSRRGFLKTSLAATAFLALPARSSSAPAASASRVSLLSGEDRADMIFRAMQPFSEDLRRRIGNRRVIVKPNNVSTKRQLASSHVDCLEGILEFFQSIGKPASMIAESAADGPTMEGFDNFGYSRLAGKYGVQLVDLDGDQIETVHLFDQSDFRPHAVRVSSLLLDRESNFVVSAAMLKTHDRVVATLTLKNIAVGAPIKDEGFRFGRDRKPGTRSDKLITHGSGMRAINYNLFDLSSRLYPDFSVIDGYQGMEGNGPTGGTAVEHRVAVASTDWLAADRVGVELMGIDFSKVGYLNFCSDSGSGVADLSQIEIIGDNLSDHVQKYALHSNIEKQLIWRTPPPDLG